MIAYGAPPLTVGDRDPIGLAPAGDASARPAASHANADVGVIRLAMWRPPIAVAPARRRSMETLAAGIALACHLGLLLILHRLPGQVTQVDGSLEIPIEIVLEVHAPPPADGLDQPATSPMPRGDAPIVPPAADAAREAAAAPSETPPSPVVPSLPAVVDAPPFEIAPRIAQAEPSSASLVPSPTLAAPIVDNARPATAAPNVARAAEIEAAPPPPVAAARPRKADEPPSVIGRRQVLPRAPRAAPKHAEIAAATERAERQRFATIAAKQVRLAEEAPALQRQEAERAAAHATPPAAAASGEDIAAYSRQVADRIAAMRHYPEDARARGAQGTVVVAFSLGSAGQVTGAVVRSSSGDASLDGEAVSTVRRAGPFGPPPFGAPRSLSVPLRYHI